MHADDDPRELLATLEAERRELLGEAEALRRFIACMRKLIDATNAHRSETEIFLLLEQVLDYAIRAVNACDGSILVPDDRGSELVFVIVRGDDPHTELVGKRLPLREGIAGWVARHRRGTIVNNVAADDRFYSGLDREIHYRTQSVLAAPLIGGDRMLGVVELINKRDGRLFSVGNQALVTLMCRFAGEVLYSQVSDIDLSETSSVVHAERARVAGREPVAR